MTSCRTSQYWTKQVQAVTKSSAFRQGMELNAQTRDPGMGAEKAWDYVEEEVIAETAVSDFGPSRVMCGGSRSMIPNIPGVSPYIGNARPTQPASRLLNFPATNQNNALKIAIYKFLLEPCSFWHVN